MMYDICLSIRPVCHAFRVISSAPTVTMLVVFLIEEFCWDVAFEFLGLAFYEIRDFIRWKGSSVSVNNLVVVIVGVSSNWSFFWHCVIDLLIDLSCRPDRESLKMNQVFEARALRMDRIKNTACVMNDGVATGDTTWHAMRRYFILTFNIYI